MEIVIVTVAVGYCVRGLTRDIFGRPSLTWSNFEKIGTGRFNKNFSLHRNG